MTTSHFFFDTSHGINETRTMWSSTFTWSYELSCVAFGGLCQLLVDETSAGFSSTISVKRYSALPHELQYTSGNASVR